MALKNHYEPGEQWHVPEGRYAYVAEVGNQLMFHRVDGGSAIPILKSEDELLRLHSARKAWRLPPDKPVAGKLLSYEEIDDVPPEGAPDDARARQFFCRVWDRSPCGYGHVALKGLLDLHKKEARSKDIKWIPSPGALQRALGRGEPGKRPLRLMFDMRGKGKRQFWPKPVAHALAETVAWYWAEATRTPLDAHAHITKLVKELNVQGARLHGSVWQRLPTPSDETVRTYIKNSQSLEKLVAKFGEDEGRRRGKGIFPGLVADRALEYVIVDSTVVDGWCVLDDGSGYAAGRPTLTVAIDVRTRVVLGVVITFEGESLYAIMACLQQVVSGKHLIADRLPQFRELLDDLYGKPECIVVDNAWAQVGVSFQDACEDASISVEWAPVKTPEYKAIVERFFLTLKKILLDKMPGGVPFDPGMMRKLGLDPRKTRALTLSQLEEFIYLAIYEIYAQEKHSGIGMAPLLAWRKALGNQRRFIIDDIGFLGSAFGTVADATLTRSGIEFRNMVFHDPEITTRLLDDLAGTTPMRKRRRRPSSETAAVKIKYNPADASAISVWNPGRKPRGYDRLPNWDRLYAATPGLGFWHNDQIKRFADAEDLAFKSEADRLLARDRFREELEAASPALRDASMRKQARLMNPAQPVLRGDVVQFGHEAPSASGLKPNDILVHVAARDRADDGIPEPGPRRGGAKAAAKAKATRKEKRAAKAREAKDALARVAAQHAQAKASPPIPPAVEDPFAAARLGLQVPDADAYYTKLKARMLAQSFPTNGDASR
ncbi:DDE-type integrase/transposase/recombinase [Enterovirga aerilata]|uniref:Transposase family protein n=1 Tax=Enterovirga aerilata TaxID=2730920 RepID=A0A849I8S9_9HYPH|nr:DDE-type integrase/transposase/recombinase [Enterovirga sp. DB1703]NNM74204.1 transposase family protein [Enterovirga sp. DB1703]